MQLKMQLRLRTEIEETWNLWRLLEKDNIIVNVELERNFCNEKNINLKKYILIF